MEAACWCLVFLLLPERIESKFTLEGWAPMELSTSEGVA